jgi:cyanophycinase
MQFPKGYLIAVGGAEDRGEEEKIREKKPNFFQDGILKQIVELAGKKGQPKIEVITTASAIPDEVGQSYKKAFRKLGVEQVGHLKIINREEADNKKTWSVLKNAIVFYFPGETS